MKRIHPILPNSLRKTIDPKHFKFTTTDELSEFKDFIGQTRALNALEFGIGVQSAGYNLYAMGSPGVGKKSLIQTILKKLASSKPVPSDWCYVNNFSAPQKPTRIELPAGWAVKFKNDMDALIENLKTSIPVIFESEAYHKKMQYLNNKYAEKQEKLFKKMGEEAKKKSLTIVTSPQGFSVVPTNEKGEVMTPEEFNKLSDEMRENKEKIIEEFTRGISEYIKNLPQIQKEKREEEQAIRREFTLSVVGSFIKDLRKKYSEMEAIVTYLDAMQGDVIDNVKDFLKQEEQQMAFPFMKPENALLRYQVNIIVDNSKSKGAPVIYEEHPIYNNLICRVEHVAQFGALFTDFSLIRGGSLHQANGGYLIIDAQKLLHHAFAWEGLKRALFLKQIKIEAPERMLGLISTTSLEPEPIPLDIKVILLGNRVIYYLLSEYDPEFKDLFKVMIDFEDSTNKTIDTLDDFSKMIAGLVKKSDLKPFHRAAVAKLCDHCCRLAGDIDKLSNHMRTITNIVQESNFAALKRGAMVVQAQDVKRAIDEQIYRNDQYRENLHELIKNNTLLIDTAGKEVGQVNALSVITLGDVFVGKPTRITTRVHFGSHGVIDIMRETKLGGPLHTKGVMTLTGFLTGRYNIDEPFSLTATLVFEQSYSGVDGDSASAAELCALLSALSLIPIKQTLAITGSLNQYGHLQAIGGVNEKIEGFYDICLERGLTGTQGVIIPLSNVRHLMLREDVVEAARNKKFHIYSAETIDEAITLLTGVEAGTRDKRNNFPKGSVNDKVEKRLKHFAKSRNGQAKSSRKRSSGK